MAWGLPLLLSVDASSKRLCTEDDADIRPPPSDTDTDIGGIRHRKLVTVLSSMSSQQRGHARLERLSRVVGER